jgi:hypothetical protein
MSCKFNNGNGAEICDGCRVMLTVGHRKTGTLHVLRTHRTLDGFHFCDNGGLCMLRFLREERGMHRARTILFAREVERLILFAQGHETLVSTLVSKQVMATPDE